MKPPTQRRSSTEARTRRPPEAPKGFPSSDLQAQGLGGISQSRPSVVGPVTPTSSRCYSPHQTSQTPQPRPHRRHPHPSLPTSSAHPEDKVEKHQHSLGGGDAALTHGAHSRWGPAWGAGCAHPARPQWRGRLRAGICTGLLAALPATGVLAQPGPQQAPGSSAQPLQWGREGVEGEARCSLATELHRDWKLRPITPSAGYKEAKPLKGAKDSATFGLWPPLDTDGSYWRKLTPYRATLTKSAHSRQSFYLAHFPSQPSAHGY